MKGVRVGMKPLKKATKQGMNDTMLHRPYILCYFLDTLHVCASFVFIFVCNFVCKWVKICSIDISVGLYH